MRMSNPTAQPDEHQVETTDERMTAAATRVLQLRVDGETHRMAVARVCESHALSRREVERSWARKKHDALSELTMGRVVDACPWTDAEVKRLSRIFAGKLAAGAASPARDSVA